ncbi:MAG: c-type cytochrome, partial [Candidatus Neomarinimicrobiota bacterium]
CTVCHRGQGRATTSPEKAHGQVEYWSEPILNGYMTQATCQACHGDIKHIQGADVINRGYELIEKYGCYGCHKIAGFEDLREVGPNLAEIGTKVNYTWLVEWLKDPTMYLEAARMPLFDFSQEEAEAVADYLFSVTVEARVDYDDEEIDWDLAEQGKIVWRQSRCNICHSTNGIGGANTKVYAPDLGKIGSKVNKEWLFNWIKDPKSYFPQTTMPRYRFTDDEIKALVEYLSSEYIDWDFTPNNIDPVQIKVESINKGKEIIRKYGCFGCHDLEGMEEMNKIGPFLRRNEVTYLRASEVSDKIGAELSSIGNKPIDRFDFGKMKKEIPNDRVNYLKQKLRETRSYRDNTLMPNFQLQEEEIEALVTLLLGFTDTNIPSRFKVPMNQYKYKPSGEFAKIVNDVNCLDCHAINGVGSDFAPDLSIEGSKVQEQWLRDFLEKPDVIRPILKQMPQFKLDDKQKMVLGNLTNNEIEIIVQYFKNVLVSNEIPEKLPDNGLDLSRQIEEGENIYKSKGCIGCHQIIEDGGAIGPNLTNVGARLTEGYIFKHLENPQALIPNIIEPNYKFSEDERINLTRYLMSLINN